jgi:chromosome segregation ATPase
MQAEQSMVKAEDAQEQLEILMKAKQSEIGDRLIQMSEKVQGMKLAEMRAQRECTEFKEKNNYLSRLLRTANDSVKKLEERVAEAESKMMRKEEEFRRADNERMRRFFNARYDDIPGALAGKSDSTPMFPNVSSAQDSGI